jgi:hypothetical protein
MTPGLNDAVITSVFHKLAMHAVTFWAEYIRAPFSRVFYINGIRVLISIEEYKTDQDTKPVFNVDEDNRIAD